MAGRVERPDDGGHTRDRATDPAGPAGDDGPGRVVGGAPDRRGRCRGQGQRVKHAPGLRAGRQVDRREFRQHREERGPSEPGLPEETQRHTHHKHRGQLRGREQPGGLAHRRRAT